MNPIWARLLGVIGILAVAGLWGCKPNNPYSPYSPPGTSTDYETIGSNTLFEAVFAGSFGQPGTAVGLNFSSLAGILVNSAGTVIYTSEMPAAALNKRVQRFSYNGINVTPTHFSNKILGNIRTLTFNPSGTYVCGLDSTGRLYHFAVANLATPTAAQPAVTFTIGTGIGEISASGSGQPSSFGSTFDLSGNFWVADTGVARVQCFTNTNTAGFSKVVNNLPSGSFTTLNLPYSVVSIPDGNLAVADTVNNRVIVMSPLGLVVKQFGNVNTTGVSTLGGFNRPTCVAINSYGQFLVTDTLNSRIERFDSNGVFLEAFGRYGSGSGELNNPLGITVDSFDTMYVADFGNSRISIWSNRVTQNTQTNHQTIWK